MMHRVTEFLRRHTLLLLFLGLAAVVLGMIKQSTDATQWAERNAQAIVDNATQNCETRAAGREVVRHVMFALINLTDNDYPSDPLRQRERFDLEQFIQKNYPSINCAEELKGKSP